MIPAKYNLRSLAVRKTTTVATALGIALVVWELASALMLSAGIRKTMASTGNEDVAIVLRKGSDAELGSVIDDATVGPILAQPGVKQDAGRPVGVGETVVVLALEKVGAKGVSNVTARGIVDGSLKVRPSLKIVHGRPARPGSDEVIIGASIAGRFRNVELERSFDLKKNRPVKVVGIFTDGGSSYESEVWVDRETLRSAFHREGALSSVRVRLESPRGLDAYRTAVERDKRLGLAVLRETDYFEKQSEGLSLLLSIMGSLIAAFFSVGAMIGAMITMYAAVAHRQREIGTLRALGFSRTSILFSFLLESSLLSLIGGAVGTAAALGMGFISVSMLNLSTWSEVVFSFDPTPRILVVALLFASGMGLLGGFFPAVRAARVSPVESMRA